MHKEGQKFVLVFGIISLILGYIWMPLFWAGLCLTVWCYYFFRNPVRTVPQKKGLIVSPADGVVSLISTLVPPSDMDLGDQERVRVSVFMNVFNCHVNRTPLSGKIRKIVYHKGKFVNASLDKASEHNERNSITFEHSKDIDFGVVQIAGLIARRIVSFINEGDKLETGDRFGLIRFGSRLDVYLPIGVKSAVSVGQTAVAGETILADLSEPNYKAIGKNI